MQIFLFGLCLVLTVSVSAAEMKEMKIDFNKFPAGSAPTNFHSALAGGGQPGEWKIVMDEVPSTFAPLTEQAPAGNRQAVLAQTSTDPASEHFPLFIYDSETFTDFKASTRFKIISGTAEQMAGLVFRFQNTSNFYVVRASALGHNVRFYKMVDGIRTDPIGPQLDIATNVWHTLAVQCQGNQLAFWFDGQLLMPPLQDNTFAGGKIGFWTKSDAVSYFCDTVINYKPRIPAAVSLVQNTLEKLPQIINLQLFALDGSGQPHIIAAKDEKEVGESGGDAEKTAINAGKVFFGREKGVVLVTLPLRDRNGDPMAAVRLRLKSFLGETENIALTRANAVVKSMQAQVTSSDELMK